MANFITLAARAMGLIKKHVIVMSLLCLLNINIRYDHHLPLLRHSGIWTGSRHYAIILPGRHLPTFLEVVT